MCNLLFGIASHAARHRNPCSIMFKNRVLSILKLREMLHYNVVVLNGTVYTVEVGINQLSI